MRRLLNVLLQERLSLTLFLALLTFFLLAWLLPTPAVFSGLAGSPSLHMALETVSVVVSMLIFGVTWVAYNRDRSGNVIILACAMAAVGLLDFVHMLSYPGMPDFITPAGPEKTISFWLAARALGALGLVLVAFQGWWPRPSALSKYLVLSGWLGLALLLIGVGLFFPGLLPKTFNEGSGLTPAKVWAEYMICALLAVPLVVFFRQWSSGVTHDAAGLFWATGISILSEITFTLYRDVTDILILLGHIYKVIAYLYIFRALFVATVKEPYQRLARTEEELRSRQQRLDIALEATNTGLWQWDPVARVVELSPTYYTMLGWEPGGFPASVPGLAALIHPDDWRIAQSIFRRAAFSGNDLFFSREWRMKNRKGEWRWIFGRAKAIPRDTNGRARNIVGANIDITDRKRAELQEKLRNEILEKLARDASLSDVLNAVTAGIETLHPGTSASVLLLDEDGRLRTGAAPSLPGFLLDPLEGAPVSEGLAPCAAAAYRAERIIVEDIQQDSLWQPFAALAVRAGFASCWCQPAFDTHGKVVATVSIYSPVPSMPTELDLASLNFAANLVAIAVERQREGKQLRMAMKGLQSSGEAIYWLDEDGRILYVNPAAEQELGYSLAELRQMGVPDIDPNVPQSLWGKGGEMMRSIQAGLKSFQTLHRHRDGHLIPVEIDSYAFDYDGTTYAMAICHDISERQAAENALRSSEEKFSALFNFTPSPSALTRLEDGVILEVNRSFPDFFGFTPEEVIGRSTVSGDLGIWVNDEDRRQWRGLLERKGEVMGFETTMRRRDGSTVIVLLSGKVVDMAGQWCVVSNIHDISGKKEHELQLEEIAHHDPLTGLPNRLLLHDRLSQTVIRNRRGGTKGAVCYLDLDGFKQVNDRFGHQAGDQLLIEAARRLQAMLRADDTVARLGGDEFVVLLSGLSRKEQCDQVLARILQSLSEPYTISEGVRSCVTVSIGVILFPEDNSEPDVLLRQADRAMYAAKQNGKNRYHYFEFSLEEGKESS